MMASLMVTQQAPRDDVRGICGAVRKGEMRAGVGTGAVEGSIGEERNESVKRTVVDGTIEEDLLFQEDFLHVMGNLAAMIVQSI